MARSSWVLLAGELEKGASVIRLARRRLSRIAEDRLVLTLPESHEPSESTEARDMESTGFASGEGAEDTLEIEVERVR